MRWKNLTDKLKIYSESGYFTARRFAERYSNNNYDADKRTEYLAREFYKNVLNLRLNQK